MQDIVKRSQCNERSLSRRLTPRKILNNILQFGNAIQLFFWVPGPNFQNVCVCVCVCVCCSMGASNTTLSNSQGPAGEFDSVLTLSTHMLYQIPQAKGSALQNYPLPLQMPLQVQIGNCTSDPQVINQRFSKPPQVQIEKLTEFRKFTHLNYQSLIKECNSERASWKKRIGWDVGKGRRPYMPYPDAPLSLNLYVFSNP